MSLDRSLKAANSLAKHRNVLSRAERMAKLSERGKFDMSGGSPLGLPKVANRKVAAAGKVKKKEAAEGAEGVEGVVAPVEAVAAPAAKPAAGGKAAGKGGKGGKGGGKKG
jgi:small basic protein (TIGR04137 family)